MVINKQNLNNPSGTKLQILACFKDGCGAKDIVRLDIDVSLR